MNGPASDSWGRGWGSSSIASTAKGLMRLLATGLPMKSIGMDVSL